MIDPDTLYTKTEAGVVEMKARHLSLRAELRRLLIVIDGNTPLKRLAVFVRGSEIDLLIAELEALGLVSSDKRAASRMSPPAAAMTDIGAIPRAAASLRPAAPASEGILEPTAAQMRAVRQTAISTLHDLLGADGDAQTVKIERCNTAQELRVAITEIRQTLDRQLGLTAGQRFLNAVRSAAESTR